MGQVCFQSLVCIIAPFTPQTLFPSSFQYTYMSIHKSSTLHFTFFYPRNSDCFTGLGMPTSTPREAKLTLLRLHWLLLLCAKCSCMGLGLKMNRQMKNKILQLFTKNQAKDKESSFVLEKNWPGNGAKDTLNPPPFTSLSSALSRGRGTVCKLITSLESSFSEKSRSEIWPAPKSIQVLLV